ncbi:MAG: glycosyltransferase, partial [Panacibacter sp.]
KKKIINTVFQKKKIKDPFLKRKTVHDYIKQQEGFFDIVIVLGLDDAGFLRDRFPLAKIIYWIHGISAIYKKEYLQHINKIDLLWSPTTTVYKKIINELHPVPFTAEFQLFPNWADQCFSVCNGNLINETRQRHKITADSKVFIFCGGNIKLKGRFILETAFRRFNNQSNHEVIVIIAGETAKSDELIAENVRFVYPGLIDPVKLAAYYRVAAFGLFPSLGGYEHAPLALIEMITCNVLPVASDVGGINEMLGADYPMLVDAPHSIDEWIIKIEQLLATDVEAQSVLLSFLQNKMQQYSRKNTMEIINKII